MARVRELGVWLRGERVATLRAPRVGRVTCTYDGAVLAAVPLGLPLLSCSLPVRAGAHDAWAFVTGLLPEGQHRNAMASLAGVTTTDLLGMLARFGRDVAGAVVIGTDDDAGRDPVRAPRAAPYSNSERRQAVAELNEHPLGLHDDSELSVAGLQDKMLLVARPDGGWARPVHGYPSTHILKVDSRVHRGLVRAEHASLLLARAAGLPAADSALLTVGDTECIIVTRFDRAGAPDGSVERVHQEDACQALGVDPEQQRGMAKYEAYGGPSLRQIAGLLEAWGANPEDELMCLLDRTVFTVAIGDADAHAKNVSLLHPEPGRVSLAPMYDTVPTVMWATLRTRAAMRIHGLDDLGQVSVAALVDEASSWGISKKRAGIRVRDLCERVSHSLASGAINVDTAALGIIKRRLVTLTA